MSVLTVDTMIALSRIKPMFVVLDECHDNHEYFACAECSGTCSGGCEGECAAGCLDGCFGTAEME